MRHSERSKAVLLMYRFLKEHAGKEDPVTVPDIIAMLNESNISCDRRTVYKLLNDISDIIAPISKIRHAGHHAYCIAPSLTLTDAYILTDAIRSNPALSGKDKKRLEEVIRSLIPLYDRASLPQDSANSDGDPSLCNDITTLLNAIRSGHLTSFLYYDKDPRGRRRYRHNKTPYFLQPMRILFTSDRYYCIFWSTEKQQPLNFRIDKMDDVKIRQEVAVPVTFDLEAYMNKTFRMYTGTSETITLRCHKEMSSALYDNFPKENIMINAMEKDNFVVTIRTAIVPTLLSWLFQYSDQVEVLRPASLIERLSTMAAHILKTYNK